MTVMQDEARKLLGIGLYTRAEAARYARISSARTLTRWLFGSGDSDPVIDPQMPQGPEGDRIVTFLDFVQLLAIRAIRIEKKVSLQKIREALDEARDRYAMPYPFACPHTTYLFGSEIIVIPPGKRDELVQITGRKGQHAIREVAELYMEDLVFQGDQGLASRFRIFRKGDLEIVMDPKIRFGQPFLPSCGYSAGVLIHAFETEGTVQAAARCYDVEPAQIKLALAFRDFILGSKAA
jgi:uncharacterized protein (DUF433 family)